MGMKFSFLVANFPSLLLLLRDRTPVCGLHQGNVNIQGNLYDLTILRIFKISSSFYFYLKDWVS